MRAVEFAPDGRGDLVEIYSYIAERDPAAATRLIARIRQAVENLREFPFQAALAEEYGAGVRKKSIAGYAIFYRVDDDAVLVSRVLHGRRDWGAFDI